MRKKILIIIFALAFAFSAHAQVQSSDIVLDLNPQYPAPNQSVTATVSSYSVDLDKAYISWSVNNQQMQADVGKKSFSFNLGGVGTATSIEARIRTFDGQNVIKRAILTPAQLDMLWEAEDVYTPPFYRGKALVPSEGSFKVVALPNLVTSYGRVSANNLSYAWTKDGESAQDASGWGKNYFIFKNSYLENSNTVEVTVSDASGATNASGLITLNTSSPEIIFYKLDPVLGTNYAQALSDGTQIDKNGETLVAEPYFFSPKNLNSTDLSFDWSLNGDSIITPSPQNILSIKPQPGQSGSAIIKVAINNTNTLFQSLEKDLHVNF